MNINNNTAINDSSAVIEKTVDNNGYCMKQISENFCKNIELNSIYKVKKKLNLWVLKIYFEFNLINIIFSSLWELILIESKDAYITVHYRIRWLKNCSWYLLIAKKSLKKTRNYICRQSALNNTNACRSLLAWQMADLVFSFVLSRSYVNLITHLVWNSFHPCYEINIGFILIWSQFSNIEKLIQKFQS